MPSHRRGRDATVGIRPPRGERPAAGVARRIARWAVALLARALVGAIGLLRLVLCALLVLLEPLLRATLVPLASLGFAVTVVFGFLIGDPRFPRWGMLAFSVGALWTYWLFIALLGVVVGRPHGPH